MRLAVSGKALPALDLQESILFKHVKQITRMYVTAALHLNPPLQVCCATIMRSCEEKA